MDIREELKLKKIRVCIIDDMADELEKNIEKNRLSNINNGY